MPDRIVSKVTDCKTALFAAALLLLFITICLVIVFITTGCGQVILPARHNHDDNKNQIVHTEEGTDMSQEKTLFSKPAMDLDLPDTLETATFALG